MSLIFPTFPTPETFLMYPARPTEDGEAAFAAFLEALGGFFQGMHQQQATTNRYYQAVNFCFDDSNQEGLLRTHCANVGEEAIASVIKNIAPPTRCEYVWDHTHQQWTLRRIPV